MSGIREFDFVLASDSLNHARRVEKPKTVMFPVIDVVAEILGDAIRHCVYALHIWDVQPAGPSYYALRYIAEFEHDMMLTKE